MIYVPKTEEQRSYHAAAKRQACVDHLAMVSRRLREMADRVDRQSADGQPISSIHELMWGLANLNLDRLAGLVAEANAFEAITAALDGEDGAEAREGLGA